MNKWLLHIYLCPVDGGNIGFFACGSKWNSPSAATLFKLQPKWKSATKHVYNTEIHCVQGKFEMV